MSENIKVSVITPTYNRKSFVEKAVAMLQQQTLKDIEFLLVDDGSEDGSYQTMKELATDDERFVVLKQKHSGPYDARNKALKRAKGQYVGFFDIDDQIPEAYFAEMYNLAHKSKADIVKATYNSKHNLIDNIERPADKFNLLPNGALWDKLYNREFLKSHNIKFAEGLYTADNLFNVKAFYYARQVAITDKVAYKWIKQDDSIGKDETKEKRRKDNILRVMQKILAFTEHSKMPVSERVALQDFTKRSLLAYPEDADFRSKFAHIWYKLVDQYYKKTPLYLICAEKLKLMGHKTARQKYFTSLVKNSPFFDEKWYLQQYPDVAKGKINPARHFVLYGLKEKRNPSQYFDAQEYVKQYPQVKNRKVNPLIHYIVSGQKEGRTYCDVNGTMHEGIKTAEEREFLWDKIRYALEYPLRVQEEYERLKAEIEQLENMK